MKIATFVISEEFCRGRPACRPASSWKQEKAKTLDSRLQMSGMTDGIFIPWGTGGKPA